MIRKAVKNAVENKLAFKRESIRNLSVNETREIVGGQKCNPETCNTVTCTGGTFTTTIGA